MTAPIRLSWEEKPTINGSYFLMNILHRYIYLSINILVIKGKLDMMPV